MGAKLFHADRRTDMMKLMVACHNFVSAPKMWPSSVLKSISTFVTCLKTQKALIFLDGEHTSAER